MKAAGKAGETLCAFGLGRSYGDSCLNPSGRLIKLGLMDHFISFDRESGLLRAEAGVSLAEVLKACIPAGWFLPVTPGSQHVTLGGAVANDVHGKNHHVAGTFGAHVKALELLTSDGLRHTLEPRHPRFSATVGGLGLTGLITWVELQLSPIGSAFVESEQQEFSGLDEFIQISEDAEQAWPYTVAWLDCVNLHNGKPRGIFIRGRFSSNGDFPVKSLAGKPSVPLDLPGFSLNRWTVGLFNRAYYQLQRRRRQQLQHYQPFFYPLDGIDQWNRVYGRKGFYQYQFVVPHGRAEEAMVQVLQRVTHSGQASFLSVLKRFGDQPSPGLLSFPQSGLTLAMDFRNRGQATLDLLESLDRVVLDAGGRIYPAKDARVSAASFRSMYPLAQRFEQYVDPLFCSDFWRRVWHD